MMDCQNFAAETAAAFSQMLDIGLWSGAFIFGLGFSFGRLPDWIERFLDWRESRSAA